MEDDSYVNSRDEEKLFKLINWLQYEIEVQGNYSELLFHIARFCEISKFTTNILLIRY